MALKVLMTADTVGGVWTYALELARALAPGVQVALATMGALPTAEQRAEASAVPGLELHESDFPLEWMDNPWEGVGQAGDWLLELECRLSPDLVHLNGYAHAALAWRAPVLMVGHSCVLSWWMAVKGAPAPRDWDRYRCEVARGLRAAQLVAAPTQFMLSELERWYGPLPRSRVIPNARDASRFRPGVKEAFVFSAGRLWDEAKNTAALERAAARLAWPVYIAGDARHPNGTESACGQAHRLGRLDEGAVANWLARASIYALPARYEPFGLSALEAALAGCALVLGDIPSLREVWADAACFVPPDDEEALASALRRLIADSRSRETMAARARRRALRFAPAQMAAAYGSAYHLLLTPV